MKTRIEKLIHIVEQMHAEAIVDGLQIENALEDVLNDLYWAYKEVTEYDVQ